MQSMWQLVYLGLAVLLCTSVSSMAVGKDTVSTATLEQLQLIENSIDHSVEPCDNFYEYACANWENQKFTGDMNSTNHVIFQKNFVQALENMFISEYPNEENVNKQNQSFEDKVLTFYYSCKKNGKFEYFKELKPSSDIEWPLIDDLNGKPESNMEQFDLFVFLGQLFSFGFDNFLLRRTVRRESNGSLYIELDSAYDSGLQRSNFMLQILLSLGYNPVKDLQKMKKHVKEFKETLAQWLATYEEYSVENSEVFSYQQTKQLYPQVAKFLDQMLPNQLKDDDIVKINDIKYIDFLTKKEWQPEELRKLCNYAMIAISQYLGNQASGNCIDIVHSKMHFAVNYMYRQHYYTAEVKATFNDLREKIYKYVLEIVNENRLLFNAEQLKAITDKLARTYISIGNVPDNANDAMVEEFYRHMPDMDISNYSGNLLLSVRQRFLETIDCPEHMECLDDIGHGTYNIPEKDLVIFSLASLKPAMYDHTFDPILAVSLMGLFIGHEYGHSIDTDALMDSELYPSLYEEFKNQTNIQTSIECSNEQFSTDYLRQLQVDLVGARAAFRAYTSEYNVQPSFTKIPWQQLFFLNYAQFFCEWKDGSGNVRTVRTNHVAMNMDEFAQAYKCPAGSKMNPVKKCLLY